MPAQVTTAQSCLYSSPYFGDSYITFNGSIIYILTGINFTSSLVSTYSFSTSNANIADLSSYTISAKWCSSENLPSPTPAITVLSSVVYDIYETLVQMPFSTVPAFWSFCADPGLSFGYNLT